MKMNSKLYKTLTQKEFADLNLQVSRRYSYKAEDEIREIKEAPFDDSSAKNVFQLIDDNYEWNPKEQSLRLNFEAKLSNTKLLFGLGGVCHEDAKLGVGLVWKPKKSRIKRCQRLGYLDVGQNEMVISSSFDIPNLSSDVEFYLVIYIARAGHDEGNAYLANDEGMVVYSERLWTIIVEGEASIFPITEIEDEGGPIWSYRCDVNDLTQDVFDKDGIEIYLNVKHPSYPLICTKSENYCEPYVNEVLSTALAVIIIDLRSKQEGNAFDLNEDCEKDSVLNVLKYYSDKLGFKINESYDALLRSIKNFFDKGM